MGFYKNVQIEIKAHYPDQEEYIRIGEIRYIKSLGIFYECTEFGMIEPYYDKQTQVLSNACSWCIFGSDERFTPDDCKACTPIERRDCKRVIFREVNPLLNK